MKLRFQMDELRRLEMSGVVKRIEILADEESCLACKKLNGKTFSFEEAAKENPIPAKDCNHEYGCRCAYLPKVR